jgi:DNA modification methylase
MSEGLLGEPLDAGKRKIARAKLRYLADRPNTRKTTIRIIQGDVRKALASLPDESVHCVVTSPPYYGLRDYKTEPRVWAGQHGCAHEWSNERIISTGNAPSKKSKLNGGKGPQPGEKYQYENAGTASTGTFCQYCNAWRGHLGLEPTLDLYIEHIVEIFREIRRVLRDDGTFWLNIGDSYASGGGTGAQGKRGQRFDRRHTQEWLGVNRRWDDDGIKPKDLLGIPWMLAFALRADGWYLRSEIIWHKRSPMPESVTDRPTNAQEKIFLLTKAERYFYDAEAIKEEAAAGADLGFLRGNAWVGDERVENSHHAGSGMRNMRNVWTFASEPLSEGHYAAFPTELPRRCILAGTSAHGVCADCGSPCERVVEKHLEPGAKAAKTFVIDERDAAADAKDQGSNRQKDGHKPGWRRADKTIGWHPTCDCNAGNPAPPTILDPFLGSGTSALVAAQLGCNAIGIELSPEYVAMAQKAISQDTALIGLSTVSVEQI